MEPEASAFLVRIVKSLSTAILWMLANMTLGLFFGFGTIHSSLSILNIFFYLFFVSSLAALIWYLLKIWKGHLQP